METCAGTHPRARESRKPGHTVRPIPPAYAEPSVKRQKNDVAPVPGTLSGGDAAVHPPGTVRPG